MKSTGQKMKKRKDRPVVKNEAVKKCGGCE